MGSIHKRIPMAHREKIGTMLDDTRDALGGGAPNSTPEEGVNLVEDWIVILRTQPEWAPMVGPLEQLRDALDAKDFVAVQHLLKQVADEASTVAEQATESYRQSIESIVVDLRDFSKAMAK